jgi:uncharacterized repeat protein (TIGR01451 family)
MKFSILNIFATLFFSVLASSAIAQATCTIASDGYLLDWNNETYTTGSTTFSTNINRNGTGGGPGSDPVSVGVVFSGSTTTFIGGFPQNAPFFTGGKGVTQNSLSIANDFNATDESLIVTLNFGAPVYNLNFEIFDIDQLAASGGTNGFRDSVTVTGFEAVTNTTRLPALTTPYNTGTQGQVAPSTVYVGNPLIANRALANASSGNSASGNNQDLGNVIVNFNQPVNRVTIRYQSPSDYFTSTNPQGQGIGIYDFAFCVPRLALLTFNKDVSIHSETAVDCGIIPGTSDPLATAAVPGSCLQYDITITNVGGGVSSATDIIDQLSTNMIFAGATASGFTTTAPTYAFTTPAPLADCGISTCTVRVDDAILPSGSTGNITIRTILK